MLIVTCHREFHETTVRYHTHLSEWLKSKTLVTPNAGEHAKRQAVSLMLAGNANGTGPWANSLAVSYKANAIILFIQFI